MQALQQPRGRQIIQITVEPDGHTEVEGLLPSQRLIHKPGELHFYLNLNTPTAQNTTQQMITGPAHHMPSQTITTMAMAPINASMVMAQSAISLEALPNTPSQKTDLIAKELKRKSLSDRIITEKPDAKRRVLYSIPAAGVDQYLCSKMQAAPQTQPQQWISTSKNVYEKVKVEGPSPDAKLVRIRASDVIPQNLNAKMTPVSPQTMTENFPRPAQSKITTTIVAPTIVPTYSAPSFVKLQPPQYPRVQIIKEHNEKTQVKRIMPDVKIVPRKAADVKSQNLNTQMTFASPQMAAKNITYTALSPTTSTTTAVRPVITLPNSVPSVVKPSLPQFPGVKIIKEPNEKTQVKGIMPGQRIVQMPDIYSYDLQRTIAGRPVTLTQIASTTTMASMNTSTASTSYVKMQAPSKQHQPQKVKIIKGPDKRNEVRGIKSGHQWAQASDSKLRDLRMQTSSVSQQVAGTMSVCKAVSQVITTTTPTTTASVTTSTITSSSFAKTKVSQQSLQITETFAEEIQIKKDQQVIQLDNGDFLIVDTRSFLTSEAATSSDIVPTKTTATTAMSSMSVSSAMAPSLAEMQASSEPPWFTIQIAEVPKENISVLESLPDEQLTQGKDGILNVWVSDSFPPCTAQTQTITTSAANPQQVISTANRAVSFSRQQSTAIKSQETPSLSKFSGTQQRANSVGPSKYQVVTPKNKTTLAANSSQLGPLKTKTQKTPSSSKLSSISLQGKSAGLSRNQVSIARNATVEAASSSHQEPMVINHVITPSTSKSSSSPLLMNLGTVGGDQVSTRINQTVTDANLSQEFLTMDPYANESATGNWDQQLASGNTSYVTIGGKQVLVRIFKTTESVNSEDQSQIEVKRLKKRSELENKSKNFITAIENDDSVAVNNLLKTGFDPNNPFSAHCVSVAAARNSLDMIKLLVKYNANINRRVKPHESALSVAVGGGHHDTVAFLVNHGANVLERDSEGLCLLHLIFKSALKAFHAIAREAPPKPESGPDWSPVYSDDTISLEGDLSSELKGKMIEAEFRYFMVMKHLLEKDSSKVNKRCCENRTILCSLVVDSYSHYTYSKQIATFVKLLLKFGADVNIPFKGKPPLLLAIHKSPWLEYGVRRSEIPEILLMYGARVDALFNRNLRKTILHYLIRKNKVTEFRLVLSYVDIDVNSEKYYYHAMPLLHYAFYCDRPSIVKLLLIAGGNVLIKDKNNRSLLQLYNLMKERFKGEYCKDLVLFFIALAIEQNKYQLTPEEDELLNSRFFYDYTWNKLHHDMDWDNLITKTLPISLLELFSASNKKLSNFAKKYVPKNFQKKPGFGKYLKGCYPLIEARLEKGRERLELLSEKSIIQKLTNFISPSVPLDLTVINKVINLLTNVDLRNLIRASAIGVFYDA